MGLAFQKCPINCANCGPNCGLIRLAKKCTYNPARQNGDFGRNFAIFLPMVPHPLFLSPHVYGIPLFSSIFCLKWYPICCFSAHMFTVFAYFSPLFRLTFCPYSAGPVLPGNCGPNCGPCGKKKKRERERGNATSRSKNPRWRYLQRRRLSLRLALYDEGLVVLVGPGLDLEEQLVVGRLLDHVRRTLN